MDIEAYARINGIEFFEGSYDYSRWHYVTEGLEKEPESGFRCEICFNMRLNQVARYAAVNDFEWFATTLTISPHKNSRLVNRIGKHLAEDYGINFYKADFKKNNGFHKTVSLSKEMGFYRQNYCGCVYSCNESRKRRQHREEMERQAEQIISPCN